MRYVNLKKRNTNKLQFITKRVASASVLCFCLTAVVVLPLISKAKTLQAQTQNQEVDISNEIDDKSVQCQNEYFAELVF